MDTAATAEPVTDVSELTRGAKTLANHAAKFGWRWIASQNELSTVVKLDSGASRAVAYWSLEKEKLKLVGVWIRDEAGNPKRVTMTELKEVIKGGE